MHAFTDGKSRTWELTIDVTAVKRVRATLQIDLYDVGRPELLAAILNDPCRLIDLLYVLCRDQAEQRQLSDEDFGRGFAGDSIESAASAFVEELIDFFPDPRRRESLRGLVSKGKTLGDRLLDQMARKVQTIDPATMDLDSLLPTLSATSVGSPASSDSTPAPSRSAS